MEHYFIVNTLISIAIITLITYGQGTHRANYWLTWLGMGSWFIPYSVIGNWLSARELAEPVILSSELGRTVSSAIQIMPKSLEFAFWLQLSLSVVCIVGMCLFARQWLDSYFWQRMLITSNTCKLQEHLTNQHQVPIYAADNVPSGMLIGWLSPKIIIANTLLTCVDKSLIELIICHEKTHLMRKDNWRLLLLSFVSCLFWWNPLVRKLVTKNKFYMELRCDQSTSLGFNNRYGKKAYVEGLAALVLAGQRTFSQAASINTLPTNTAPANAMVSSVVATQNENIARIKLLNQTRKITMTSKLAYAFITSMLLSMMALTVATTATATTLATVMTNHDVRVSEQAGDMGAEVEFNITVNDRSDPDHDNEYRYRVVLWTDFNQKSSIKVGDNFEFPFSIEDLGDNAKVNMEIVEYFGANKTVAKPVITFPYGEEGMIKISNPDVSMHSYQIKVAPVKTPMPQ